MKCDKISSIPEKNKLVVLISDGQPNYYYNANGNLKNPGGGEASAKEVCDSAVAAANELPGEKYAVYIGKLSDSCYGSYSGSEPAETTLSYYKLLPGAATVTVTHKYIPYITVTSYEKDDEGNIISWKTEELPDEENIAEYTVYYGKEGEDRTKKQYAPEELSGGKLNEIIDEATEINFYYIESSLVPASYEVYTKTRKYNITVNGPVLVSDPELAKDKEYKGYKKENR